MGVFQDQIEGAAPTAADVRARQWMYVPYDRLTDAVGPLSESPAKHTGIVMMEALEKARRRPYHKKKLTLILASQRQFAIEQAARGVRVAYVQTPGGFADGLELARKRFGIEHAVMMEPAEREMRLDMEKARGRKAGIVLEQVPDTTWLSTIEDFERVYGKPGKDPVSKHYLMDRFYRAMREKTGYLMRGGKPEGGQFSYDADNRKPYRGKPAVPKRRVYAPDALTHEVMALVEREFPQHFGTTEGWDLPVRLQDIETEWQWALRELLPVFGPYEDAMVAAEPDMFHSRMSAFVNISRLLPRRIVEDVVQAADDGKIPLASAEGFVRQILGWREYMRHIHRVTDGFRHIAAPKERARRGSSKAGNAEHDAQPGPDGGAKPSALAANRPLPAVYWGAESGLHCMDTVVRQVLHEGWSHHITRLMVLSNFATLCGYSPRELTDWFWIAYIDAYDWVVEPNVLGMGTFADGGITATKPYVSGAAYVNRMSDYCGSCRFNPKLATGENACPFTALYWTFLERQEGLLGKNPRMSMPYATLRRKSAAEREALRERAESCLHQLAEAEYPASQSQD